MKLVRKLVDELDEALDTAIGMYRDLGYAALCALGGIALVVLLPLWIPVYLIRGAIRRRN